MIFSERGFIEQLRAQSKSPSSRVLKGIGDDCAVLKNCDASSGKLTLLTSDALVESVHFDLSWHPAKLLGRKSLSVNISDIAAMGGTPLFALLSIGFPNNDMSTLATDYMEGFHEVLNEHDMELVGGDTVRSSQFLASVTVIGEVHPDHILYRSGAKDGDDIWVSNHLGQAAAGFEICRRRHPSTAKLEKMVAAHLDPTPLVLLGASLGKSGLVTSMMDLSDGIATDLSHLCKESGVAAEIYEEKLPLSAEIKWVAAQMGCSAVDWALGGGEDYQLLFTTPPANGAHLQALVHEKTGEALFKVGRIVKGSGVHLMRSGEAVDVSYMGFDHFGTSGSCKA